MSIMELMKKRTVPANGGRPLTIAFLGDSVTQGCFEVFVDNYGEMYSICDTDAVYHACLKQMLAVLYPGVPVNIINAGVEGNDASAGFLRLERDVLTYQPDLVVVCFGLNDCVKGMEKIQQYQEALGKIFGRLQTERIPVIFMTPNMLNTEISGKISSGRLSQAAEKTMRIQKEGVMDSYMNVARALCGDRGITVCDCYAQWKLLAENGVDTTSLLSNFINHPVRKMHWLFAARLLEAMVQSNLWRKGAVK